METISRPRSSVEPFRKLLAIVCMSLLAGGEGALLAQEAPQATPQAAAAKPAAEKRSPDQLDSLVAPIALYPDPLLAQTLVASTYPLEVVQLQQWLVKNSTLKDKALADAVAKQPWDPSIQSMAAVPEVVKRLADDIQWTAQLGDAFLDSQSEVMDAVQRMRKKAQDKGTLTSSEQMKVETKVVEEKTVIVLEQTNPEVVYVPSYSPTVVYGAAYPYYPYPPIYYPPYYGGAWIGFGVGMFWGAAIWGGSCCGCGWGGGDININNNNNFNRNSNRNQVNPLGGDRGGNRGGDRGGNRGGRNQVNPQGGAGNRGGGNGKWSHNPQHRGGAPYSSREAANKFGGSTRGDSRASRGSAGVSNRASGGAGSLGGSAGASNRASGSAGSRGGSGGGSFSGGGGGDRIGNQSIGGSRSGSSAFGGSGSRGYSGGSARSSSSRGSSSMGSRGGGGGRGGGGRGGRR